MPTRFEGSLQSWNDERGFGFIAADQGGDPVFVHIKAFGPGAARPALAQRVSFEVELGPQGKKRARQVQLLRTASAAQGRGSASGRPGNAPAARTGQRVQPSRATGRGAPQGSARWGTASLFAIPAFLVIALVVSMLWRPPLWMALWYLGLSAVTLVVYAMDKAAAQSGGWRTPEKTLHLLALGGGWPGALVAQQWLRHKSAKAEFRAVFWLTVIANVAGFVYLCSPYGRGMLHY